MRIRLIQCVFMVTSALLFTSTLPQPIYCNEISSAMKRSSHEDSLKAYFEDGNLLGIQTAAVITDEFDTGFGCGVRLSRKFFYPSLKSSSVIHFWGASSDSTDIGVAGIEENITYRIPMHTRINGYMGIILGYCFSNEKTNKYISNVLTTSEKKKHTFVTFITFEIEYELPEHRSVFLQCKSGITDISKEIHILLGFNFKPRKKY